MQKHTFLAGHKSVTVYPAAHADAPLLLTFLTPKESDGLAALIGTRAVLAAVDEADWEGSFTPWPAPAVFKKAPAFGGGADAYLDWVCNGLLPEIKQRFAPQACWTGIIGYSLAGLFAAYSAYRPTPFTRTASVSGSLWFDGWADFVQNNPLSVPPQKAYFSIGDQEQKTANPRMQSVEQHTLATQASWQHQGVESRFERNAGGHFTEVPQRMAKAAAYLLD